MLEYKIISSNGYNVYIVSIFVENNEPKANCTCPAGKRRGLFCKHISNLLNGEKSNIIEPSDHVEALNQLLEKYPNSILSKKNNEYMDKRDPNKYKNEYKKGFIYNNVEINNIIDLYDYIKSIISKDLSVSMVGDSKLRVHKSEYLKNGKLKQNDKNTLIMMYINGDTYSFVDRYFKDWKKAGEYFIKNIENYINTKIMYVESERSIKNKEYVLLDKNGKRINSLNELFKYLEKYFENTEYRLRYSYREDFDKNYEEIWILKNGDMILTFDKYLVENSFTVSNYFDEDNFKNKDFNSFEKAYEYFEKIIIKDLKIKIEGLYFA